MSKAQDNFVIQEMIKIVHRASFVWVTKPYAPTRELVDRAKLQVVQVSKTSLDEPVFKYVRRADQ